MLAILQIVLYNYYTESNKQILNFANFYSTRKSRKLRAHENLLD